MRLLVRALVNPLVILLLVEVPLGIFARSHFADYDLDAQQGVALTLLPVYWFLWRTPTGENRIARTAITSIIAVAVWWGFLTGHVINNIRGFGS